MSQFLRAEMQRRRRISPLCAALFFTILVLPADGIIMPRFLHFPRVQQKLGHLAQGEISEQEERENPPSGFKLT